MPDLYSDPVSSSFKTEPTSPLFEHDVVPPIGKVKLKGSSLHAGADGQLVEDQLQVERPLLRRCARGHRERVQAGDDGAL